MSDSHVLLESYPRTANSASLNTSSNNNNNNDSGPENNDPNGNRNLGTPSETSDILKSRSSFLEHQDHRRNSFLGLDLSKPPLSQAEDHIGLDLSKSDFLLSTMHSRPSDLPPLTNGMASDAQSSPGSAHYGHGGRSPSSSEAVSPFLPDAVPNGYSPEADIGEPPKMKFHDSFFKASDVKPPKFSEGYPNEIFGQSTTSPSLLSSVSSPTYTNKLADSYFASKLADNAMFPRPQDAYSKILEDFGNNAKLNNNNNNIPGSKVIDEFSSLVGHHSDSPYRKIAESYAKQIESLANGFKNESSGFKQESTLSPGVYKSESPPFGSLIKSDPGISNGGSFSSKAENNLLSPTTPPAQSLPSIINFSTNHLRGMAAAESGLASYLNSFGMSSAGPERGDNKNGGGLGSGGRDSQGSVNGGGGGGGGNGGDSSSSRSSPNNKLACRFCGKTFSQAGYIKAHERLHTGEKPFACSVCGKRFSDPSNWKKHERVHANNKKPGHLLDPHESKVCGRTFAQSGSFRMHERRHLTDSIQRCHICYATFTSWQDLQRHMASHPQVTQAMLEFEDGTPAMLDRLNPADLGGQLGDGGMGQLGHPDPDGQGHGHGLLPGLYHPPGQLPPFSSILPFRHHPGAPPPFPPSFPSALGLLGPQSLPVTSHADLLTKHPFFGAMISNQMKHEALSKLSPTFSSPHQQHLLHHQQHQALTEQQQQHLQQQHPPQLSPSDLGDTISTSSASRRPAEQDQPRTAAHKAHPPQKSESEPGSKARADKESSKKARSVSSDEGLRSPEDHQMEVNEDEELLNQDHEMDENFQEDDTDSEEQNYCNERNSISGMTSLGLERIGSETLRERHFGAKNRRDSYEDEYDKERVCSKKERKSSGGSGSSGKISNDSRGDVEVKDGEGGYDRAKKKESSFHSHRMSNGRSEANASDRSWAESNGHKSLAVVNPSNYNNNNNNNNSNNDNNNGNGDDHSDLRPPKRHIERQNLNTRMIPAPSASTASTSSSSRKQRHPMRRFSSAGSDHETPQSNPAAQPISSHNSESMERGDLDDNELVTFLLTKGRVHKCVHCHMIFEDASLFLLHNGFHSHDDPFKCVVCGNVCKDRIDFNCHLTSHIK